MLIRIIDALLILRGIMGRPGITKVKWLRLRSIRAIAEGSDIVFDRIRDDIRVFDR